MKFKEWVMLPAGYQPDTADTRAEYPPGTYAMYIHEDTVCELRSKLKEVDKDLHNAEVHVKDLIAENEKLKKERDDDARCIAETKKRSSNRALEIDQLKLMVESSRLKYAELESALRGILEIGKRDMSNPKYDSYFEEARKALGQK